MCCVTAPPARGPSSRGRRSGRSPPARRRVQDPDGKFASPTSTAMASTTFPLRTDDCVVGQGHQHRCRLHLLQPGLASRSPRLHRRVERRRQTDVFFYNPTTGDGFTCVSTGTGTGGFTYGTGGWATGWQSSRRFRRRWLDRLLLYDPLAGTFSRPLLAARAFDYVRRLGPGGRRLSRISTATARDVLLLWCCHRHWVVGDQHRRRHGGFSYRTSGWLPRLACAGRRLQRRPARGPVLSRADVWLLVQDFINSGTAIRLFRWCGWSLWTTTVVDLNGDGIGCVFIDSTIASGSGAHHDAAIAIPGSLPR